jgi:hypothetical protein
MSLAVLDHQDSIIVLAGFESHMKGCSRNLVLDTRENV